MNKTNALASLDDDFQSFDFCPLDAFDRGMLFGALAVLRRGEIITWKQYELANDWINARTQQALKEQKQ